MLLTFESANIAETVLFRCVSANIAKKLRGYFEARNRVFVCDQILSLESIQGIMNTTRLHILQLQNHDLTVHATTSVCVVHSISS